MNSLEVQATDQTHHVNVLTEKIKVKDRELITGLENVSVDFQERTHALRLYEHILSLIN